MAEFSGAYANSASDTVQRARVIGDTVDRYVELVDGRRFAGAGSAQPGWAYGDYALRPPPSGFFTTPYELLSTQITMTSQLLVLSLFQAELTMSVSNIAVATGGTAAGATPSITRFGIYTISGTTATLLCANTNDTSKLTVVNTVYTYAMATPGAITRGTSYYFAGLVVTAAAAPTLNARSGGNTAVGIADSIFGSGLRMGGSIAAQADLPASFTTTNISSAATVAGLFGWLT